MLKRAILVLLHIIRSLAQPSTVQSSLAATVTPPPCHVNCIAHIDDFLRYRWQSYVINTTITVATVEHIIYPHYGNATRTRIRPGDLADGYAVPERNHDGTIVTTITLSYGTNKPTGVVLTYPTPFADYPNSYMWSGTREIRTGGSAECITQPTPVAALLPTRPGFMKPNWRKRIVRPIVPVAKPKPGGDGTNYYLVAEPEVFTRGTYLSLFGNDTSLTQCRPDNVFSFKKLPPRIETLNGPLFVTATRTVIETNCGLDRMCNVRHESTQMGSLVQPTQKMHGLAADIPRPMIASLIVPQGFEPVGSENSPVMKAPVVEEPALSLITPIPHGRGQRNAGDNSAPRVAAQSMLFDAPEPTPPPDPEALSIGTITIDGTEIPIALIPGHTTDIQGVHVEQLEDSVQIGTQTVHLGETITISNQLVAVTQAPDRARIAVIAPLNHASPATTISLSRDSTFQLSAAAGKAPIPTTRAFAAIETPIPRGPITVGNLELKPNSDGGYSVGGTSLSRGGSVTVIGVDPRADFLPSPVLLSLATNSAGQEVFGVNGESTTLALGGTATSTAKPGIKTSNAGVRMGLDVRLLLGVTFILCILG